MVEEEKSTWLQDWTEGKNRRLAEWLGTAGLVPKEEKATEGGSGSGSRRPSHGEEGKVEEDGMSEGEGEGSGKGVRSEDTHL